MAHPGYPKHKLRGRGSRLKSLPSKLNKRKKKQPAAKPKLIKTTVNGPDPLHCGGFDWDIKWGLSPNSNKINGWIVQKIEKIHTLKLCQKNNKRTYIKKSVPFWEAWQVRKGKIYVGKSSQIHKRDIFFQGMVGSGLWGESWTRGTAEFYPNLKLPNTFIPNNTKTDARSLPSTIKNPGNLAGGTGSLAHSIKVKWNCCPGRSFGQRKSGIVKTW